MSQFPSYPGADDRDYSSTPYGWSSAPATGAAGGIFGSTGNEDDEDGVTSFVRPTMSNDVGSHATRSIVLHREGAQETVHILSPSPGAVDDGEELSLPLDADMGSIAVSVPDGSRSFKPWRYNVHRPSTPAKEMLGEHVVVVRNGIHYGGRLLEWREGEVVLLIDSPDAPESGNIVSVRNYDTITSQKSTPTRTRGGTLEIEPSDMYPVRVSYRLSGMHWNPAYVAHLRNDALWSLVTLARVENSSQRDLSRVNVDLVLSSDVSRGEPIEENAFRKSSTVLRLGPTDIPKGERSFVLSETQFHQRTWKCYYCEVLPSGQNSLRYGYRFVPADTDLYAGKVSVYDDQMRFLGTSLLSDTPRGSEADLVMGIASEVVCHSSVSVKREGSSLIHEITLIVENRSTNPINFVVRYPLNLPGVTANPDPVSRRGGNLEWLYTPINPNRTDLRIVLKQPNVQ